MRCGFRPLHRNRKGIILFETLIGVVLLGLFLVTATLALLAGQQTLIRSGNRIRAFFYASRALEAARTLPFGDLTQGNYGVEIDDVSGEWSLVGTPQEEQGFTTTLSLLDLGDGSKRATATTTWAEQTNTAQVWLSTEIANWRSEVAIGDWSNPSLAGGIDYAPAMMHFTSISFGSGDYAYVTSAEPTGKLYAFDMGSANWNSIPTSDFSFSFGSQQRCFGSAVRGNRLYALLSTPPTLLTGTGFEIRAYNITHPGALASNPSGQVVASYSQENLRPLTMTVAGPRLYVGMSDTAPSIGQVISFDISNSGSITLSQEQRQFDLEGHVHAIEITGTSAFIGTSKTGGEVMARERYTLAPRTSVPEAAMPSATSNIASIGSAALLVSAGRDAGGSLRIFRSNNFSVLVNSPSLPTGNYGLRDLAMTPSRSYAFVGAQNEFGSGDVIIAQTSEYSPYWSSPISVFLDPGYLDLQHYPGVNAVAYLPSEDRLFVLTDSSILLLKPSTP